MDVLKLLELMEKKVPGHSWLLLLGACIAAVLLYKTGETLLPQLIKSIVTLLSGRVEASRQDAQTETDIRSACASTRNVNWIAALPSLAGYNWRPTVMETYFPLALHTADTQTATAAVSLTDVLNRDRFLVITGAAGSGKSTILSFLAVHFANDTVDSGLGLRESRLPICFNLIELDALPELGPPADLFSELCPTPAVDRTRRRREAQQLRPYARKRHWRQTVRPTPAKLSLIRQSEVFSAFSDHGI